MRILFSVKRIDEFNPQLQCRLVNGWEGEDRHVPMLRCQLLKSRAIPHLGRPTLPGKEAKSIIQEILRQVIPCHCGVFQGTGEKEMGNLST